MKSYKYERILDIYIALTNGKIVNTIEYANKHNVDCRTIHRDLADIRAFINNSYITDNGIYLNVYYDYQVKGYRAA